MVFYFHADKYAAMHILQPPINFFNLHSNYIYI